MTVGVATRPPDEATVQVLCVYYVIPIHDVGDYCCGSSLDHRNALFSNLTPSINCHLDRLSFRIIWVRNFPILVESACENAFLGRNVFNGLIDCVEEDMVSVFVIASFGGRSGRSRKISPPFDSASSSIHDGMSFVDLCAMVGEFNLVWLYDVAYEAVYADKVVVKVVNW